MTFQNIEVFRQFLKDNLDPAFYSGDIALYLEEFRNQISVTGDNCFELSSYQTVDGLPKLIKFQRIDTFFLDGVAVKPGADYDEVKTRIVF